LAAVRKPNGVHNGVTNGVGAAYLETMPADTVSGL